MSGQKKFMVTIIPSNIKPPPPLVLNDPHSGMLEYIGSIRY